MCAEKLDTKARIVGHWIATKRNDLPDTTTKMMAIKTISSTAIATIATKKAIKKLIAGPNSGITQTRGIRTCNNTQYKKKRRRMDRRYWSNVSHEI